MKKFGSIVLVSVMLFALFAGGVGASVVDEKTIEFPLEERWDGTHLLWDKQIEIAKKFPGLTGLALSGALNPNLYGGMPDNVGDTTLFWNLKGADLDEWYQVSATCQAVGTHCYVYVEDDEWYQPVLDGTMPEGNYVGNGYITQADVDAVKDTFDNTIYPIEATYFGTPPTYNGEDKITIFLTDLKDGWIPGEGWYAGYFYSIDYDLTDPHSNNRHMINVDTYPTIHYPDPLDHDIEGAMGVVAHEYQHLLHFWADPDETTWVNEGQSDYAEFLTMGTFPQSHLAYFFAFHSVNLEQWGSYDASIVENYGAAFLYMLYLEENFGGPSLMSAIHNDLQNGRASITGNLPLGVTFESVFKDWTLANLLDEPSLVGPNSGANLGYVNFDVPSDETWFYDVFAYTWGSGFNWDYGPYPYADQFYGLNDGYPSPDSGYWGDTQQQLDANYFRYTSYGIPPSIFNFDFMGNAFDDAQIQFAVPSDGVVEWYSGSGNGFYSGNEHLLTHTPFDFSSATNPEMYINTWIDIESGWDFGYVEVSTDGGTTWTQLQDTTGIMSNYRDPSAYVGIPGAYAFTGEDQAWYYAVHFDLSAYAGQSNVQIRFNYMTDDAYAPFGWVVDKVRIVDGATTILDGSVDDDSSWVSTTWTLEDTTNQLGWTVYVVGYPASGRPITTGDIYAVPINPLTGDGHISISGLGGRYSEFAIVPSMVTAENIGGHYTYLHAGYVVPMAGPVPVAFPLYAAALKKLDPLLEEALQLWTQAENEGKDLTTLEPKMDIVNEYIANAATGGVNWIYRSGQLNKAIQELQDIIDELTELLG
ncbi:MAG: hypothetical protein ACXQTP_00060 [Candidatus Methanofastidiosia archaeon]